MQRFVDRLHAPQQQLFQQVYRQQFGIAPRPLPGINDLAEQLAKARLPLFIRTKKAGLGKNRWPVEPLVPVGARAEVDPLVIPLAGVGMAAIVMNFPGREQQHIARPADKLFAVVVDHPLAADRQIENIAFHTQRAVDKEIQVSLRLNRRQAGNQMSVKRVARQQRIVLRFGHTRGSPRRYQWHQLSIFIILSLSALSRLRRRWEFGEKPAQQAKKAPAACIPP